MIKHGFYILALCAGLGLLAPSAHSASGIPPSILRVLTYNINALPSPVIRHKTARLNRIAQILKERREQGTQPDIVVLQEAFGERCNVIIEQSGYKYVVRGPGRKSGKNPRGTSWGVESGRSYAKRAKPQKFMGSGLIILSDYKITNPVFTTFSGQACAGLDCLANKAIVMTEITVPGLDTPVKLVTSHFNSNRSAKAPGAVRLRAHQQQTDILAKFLARTTSMEAPLILAGDFNTKLPARYQYFRKEINALDAAESCLKTGTSCALAPQTTPAEVLYLTDDKQFYRSGSATLLTPVYIERNFRELLNGRALSDHTGYEVHYALNTPNKDGQ
ncbi:MAG: endonuclease/exonuclease/phosphatase family protein [Robiginitomaculum sp.]|nr:endonuclease/exonuclease/phosphatase family protein [Robiginitomaculum sp.]MDQ7077083.1 endonuclease/exonuclease/phosphatase family protein [Robiginitomaculum sp.]